MAEGSARGCDAATTVFRKFFADLLEGITDPVMLAADLYANDVILQTTRDQVTELTIIKVKNSKLLAAVESQVRICPSAFKVFLCALRKRTTLDDLRRRMEETYRKLSAVEPPSTTVAQLPSESVPISRNQSLSPILACESASEPESFNGDVLSSTVPSRTSRFPYLDMAKMNERQKYLLECRLLKDYMNITSKFSDFIHYTIVSLKGNPEVTVTILSVRIASLGAYKPVHAPKPLLRDQLEKISTCTTIDDVFLILQQYYSFFNYGIIQRIITWFPTPDDERRLEKYTEDFKVYCERRTFECPADIFGHICEGRSVLVAKTADSDPHEKLHGKVLDWVFQLQAALAEILEVETETLYLCQIDKGCVELLFTVPSFVEEDIFPLSVEQEKSLVAIEIVKLTCGEYAFDSKTKQSPAVPEATVSEQLTQEPAEEGKTKNDKTDKMAKWGRNGTSHPKPAELHPFFEDEKCKIFLNEKCSDIDLTVVCSKISDNCFPIAAVGVCLGLEDSVVQEVTKGYEHSSHKDVLHQLLVNWKVSKENDEKDTWSSLVQSLASLANSEPLLEDIRKYLCQRDNPRPEAVGKHSHDMSAIQEETSTPDSLAFYGVSPPLSGSPASSYLQGYHIYNHEHKDFAVSGFTSAMAQETSAQSRMTHALVTGTCSSVIRVSPARSGARVNLQESSAQGHMTRALVTGSSVMPVSTARSGARVNLSVKKRLREEEEKFSALLAFSSERLQDLGVSPDKLKVYLTQLSVSQKENIPQFSEHMAGIISVDSHSKIFTFLSRIGAWGFLNFYLLKCVANRYGDDEMKSKVEEYGNEVDTFKSETKVKDYLRASSNRSLYGSLPERKPLIAKLEEEWEECTLADVAEQEGYLAGEFLLEQYIFHFSNAAPGSVTLMWLIPAPAIPLIRRAIMENRVKLKGIICELIVGDERFICKVCAPYTPKLPQIGVSEQQTGRCTITSDDPLEQLMNADYTTTYEESVRNPEKFWGDLAEKCLLWKKPFEKVMDCDMVKGEIRWFTGGKLNVSENCLDRHVERDPERIALIWEKNEPQQHESLTYRQLLDKTCRIANVLKQNGIKKGDTVVIYMPAFPLTVASMLACARIGAVHCVVFAAYNASVLRERICDAKAKAVITANQAVIGRKVLNLKENVDEAVPDTGVKVVFVATRVPGVTVAQKPRDVPLEQAMAEQPTECPPEPMDSEDRLFIIYTSGTSDNPKGIVHTQAGYLLHVAVTHRCVFNYKPGEVFSYVSDLGWLPGHTYVVYGSLCNGGTTVLFEGTACYPDYNQYWEMIERLKINHFSTSPSAIRQLMKHGDQHVLKHDLSSLKTIGTAGEPMNISAWQWYHDVVGKGRCIVLDSWWQTETGAITITPNPAPRGIKPKPGFSMKPFYGVLPVLVDEEEKEITGNDVKGRLCLKKPLPGMGRDINGDSQKYKDLYFGKHRGLYFTYDMAHRDDDGDYQIIGRVDDVTAIKGVWVDVPGIENTMNMSDPRILESFLVGYKQEGSNEFEHATFVKLMEEVDKEEINLTAVITVLKQALKSSNLKVPKSKFYIVNKQPKTHSGKIIRKFLKQLAPGTVTLVETFDGVIKMEDCLNNMGIARSFYCLTY